GAGPRPGAAAAVLSVPQVGQDRRSPLPVPGAGGDRQSRGVGVCPAADSRLQGRCDYRGDPHGAGFGAVSEMTLTQVTPAFEEFLRDTVARGELVNVVFEQRLFDLAAVLHRI